MILFAAPSESSQLNNLQQQCLLNTRPSLQRESDTSTIGITIPYHADNFSVGNHVESLPLKGSISVFPLMRYQTMKTFPLLEGATIMELVVTWIFPLLGMVIPMAYLPSLRPGNPLASRSRLLSAVEGGARQLKL